MTNTNQERQNFEAQIAKYPPPKRDLMLMLKYTAFGGRYEIKFHGTQLGARQYIAAMRTHLSRFRAEAEEKGVKLRRFKIMHVSITSEMDETKIPYLLITLEKKQQDSDAIADDVSMVLSSIGLTP